MVKDRELDAKRWRHIAGRAGLYAVLILGALIMLLPFLWMLSTSVMTLGEANAGRLLPRAARLNCPHVNLPKYIEGSVERFQVSPTLRPNTPELHTDSYYVEIGQMEDGGEWRFRLVNNEAEPVEIVPVGGTDENLTTAWQPIPAGAYDTGRGLIITFAPAGAYTAADRRSGAARVDYVNCCEYPTWVLDKQLAEKAGRTYTGPIMSTDLTTCRTFGHQISYFFNDFLTGNYRQAWVTAKFGKYIGNSIIITLITIAPPI